MDAADADSILRCLAFIHRIVHAVHWPCIQGATLPADLLPVLRLFLLAGFPQALALGVQQVVRCLVAIIRQTASGQWVFEKDSISRTTTINEGDVSKNSKTIQSEWSFKEPLVPNTSIGRSPEPLRDHRIDLPSGSRDFRGGFASTWAAEVSFKLGVLGMFGVSNDLLKTYCM